MPSWSVHVIAGLAAGVAVALARGWPIGPSEVVLMIIAALAPDLDHNKSKASQALHLGLVAACAAFFYALGPAAKGLTVSSMMEWVVRSLVAAAVMLGLLMIARASILKHRGFTHSLAATLLFGGLVWAATTSQALVEVGVVAYASHWVLDGEWKLT